MIRHYRTGKQSFPRKNTLLFTVGITLCLGLMLLAVTGNAQISFKQTIGSGGTGNGQFDGPFGNAVAKNGDLYVADYKHHQIEVFDAGGVFKFAFGEEGNGDGDIRYPVDVAFDSAGHLYVLQNEKVQVFTAAGDYLRKFSVNSGYGLAMDPAGFIYVICAFEIMKFNTLGQLQKRWGTYGKANGQLDNAYKAVVDRLGRLYVVELFNHRIQVFTGDGEFVAVIGNEGNGEGQFKYPAGIALDASGNLYVADQGNHRIQIFNSAGVFQKAFGSLGSTEGKFQNPIRVTIDDYGKLFISDYSNNRIQVYAKAANAIIGFQDIEKTYGDESFVLSAESSSTAPITFREVIDETTTGDVTLDGSVVVINKAGLVKLRAHAGDDLETAGAIKDITLTVHKAPQAIEFDPLPVKILGTGTVQLPVTSTVGLDISYESTDEAVAVVNGHVITLVDAGETTIIASQAGNENYAAAENVEQVLTVQMITDSEADQLDGITVHPNPTTDFITVAGSINGLLTVFDNRGQSVLVSGAKTLDLRSLPSGIYFVKLTSDGVSSFKRIIRR